MEFERSLQRLPEAADETWSDFQMSCCKSWRGAGGGRWLQLALRMDDIQRIMGTDGFLRLLRVFVSKTMHFPWKLGVKSSAKVYLVIPCRVSRKVARLGNFCVPNVAAVAICSSGGPGPALGHASGQRTICLWGASDSFNSCTHFYSASIF